MPPYMDPKSKRYQLLIRQYLNAPNEQTFVAMRNLVERVVNSCIYYSKLEFDKEPVIGHVMGRLSEYDGQKSAFKFLVYEVLNRLRYYYKKEKKFETYIGNKE
jgi:hypothetical protein